MVAVSAMVDTSLLVDVLRGHEPAVIWMEEQSTLGTTTIVWMELLQGAANKVKQREAVKLLNQFERTHPTAEDFDWAYEQMITYHLSHNIGGWDALIASVSYRLKVPLYTGNLKHFAPMLGELAQKPY